MGKLRLAALHLVTLRRATSNLGGRLAHDEVLHLLLQLYVNGFLVLNLTLIHLNLLSLDCKVLVQ